MTDEPSAALFSTLANDALPNLTELQLQSNEIGDEGMAALAQAIERGALTALKAVQRSAAALEANTANSLTKGINLSENPGSTLTVWRAIGVSGV